MKLSGYLCLLLGAVYVTAAPAIDIGNEAVTPGPGRDEQYCKTKCQNDHKEMVAYCNTLNEGKQSCLNMAELVGSPEGQKQCVYFCMRLG